MSMNLPSPECTDSLEFKPFTLLSSLSSFQNEQSWNTVNDRLSAEALICIFQLKMRRLFDSGAYFKDG